MGLRRPRCRRWASWWTARWGTTAGRDRTSLIPTTGRPSSTTRTSTSKSPELQATRKRTTEARRHGEAAEDRSKKSLREQRSEGCCSRRDFFDRSGRFAAGTAFGRPSAAHREEALRASVLLWPSSD